MKIQNIYYFPRALLVFFYFCKIIPGTSCIFVESNLAINKYLAILVMNAVNI